MLPKTGTKTARFTQCLTPPTQNHTQNRHTQTQRGLHSTIDAPYPKQAPNLQVACQILSLTLCGTALPLSQPVVALSCLGSSYSETSGALYPHVLICYAHQYYVRPCQEDSHGNRWKLCPSPSVVMCRCWGPLIRAIAGAMVTCECLEMQLQIGCPRMTRYCMHRHISSELLPLLHAQYLDVLHAI